MSYEEFKQLQAQGKVEVDKTTVSDLLDDLPKKERNSITRWATLGVVSAVIGILLIGTFSFWLGIIVLAAGSWWCSKKAKEVSQSVILAYAEQNENFFNELVARNALKTR